MVAEDDKCEFDSVKAGVAVDALVGVIDGGDAEDASVSGEDVGEGLAVIIEVHVLIVVERGLGSFFVSIKISWLLRFWSCSSPQ